MAINNKTLFSYYMQALQGYLRVNGNIAISENNCKGVEGKLPQIFNTTTVIKGLPAFNGYMFLSVDNSLSDKIIDVFLDGCELDCDKDEMRNDVIGELLNTVLGNALVKINDGIDGVSFGTPHIADFNAINYLDNKNIFGAMCTTEHGNFSVAYCGD